MWWTSHRWWDIRHTRTPPFTSQPGEHLFSKNVQPGMSCGVPAVLLSGGVYPHRARWREHAPHHARVIHTDRAFPPHGSGHCTPRVWPLYPRVWPLYHRGYTTVPPWVYHCTPVGIPLYTRGIHPWDSPVDSTHFTRGIHPWDSPVETWDSPVGITRGIHPWRRAFHPWESPVGITRGIDTPVGLTHPWVEQCTPLW